MTPNSGNRLTWMNPFLPCQILLLFPALFIQSVHFWQADLKHDNGSGLVIHQHASAAAPFHPSFTRTLTMVMLHTAGKCFRKHTFNTENRFHTESNGFIILSCTFRRSALFFAAAESRDEIFTHPQSLLPTPVNENHTARLPHSCRGWQQRVCCGGITVQWKFGACPAQLKPSSCRKTHEAFTQRDIQTSGGQDVDKCCLYT